MGFMDLMNDSKEDKPSMKDMLARAKELEDMVCSFVADLEDMHGDSSDEKEPEGEVDSPEEEDAESDDEQSSEEEGNEGSSESSDSSDEGDDSDSPTPSKEGRLNAIVLALKKGKKK